MSGSDYLVALPQYTRAATRTTSQSVKAIKATVQTSLTVVYGVARAVCEVKFMGFVVNRLVLNVSI